MQVDNRSCLDTHFPVTVTPSLVSMFCWSKSLFLVRLVGTETPFGTEKDMCITVLIP